MEFKQFILTKQSANACVSVGIAASAITIGICMYEKHLIRALFNDADISQYYVTWVRDK